MVSKSPVWFFGFSPVVEAEHDGERTGWQQLLLLLVVVVVVVGVVFVVVVVKETVGCC